MSRIDDYLKVQGSFLKSVTLKEVARSRRKLTGSSNYLKIHAVLAQ